MSTLRPGPTAFAASEAPTVNQREPGEPLPERLSPPATSAELPNAIFGEYELLDQIGRGGMGVVYRARHRRLDRIVALKMILDGPLASQQDVQRFRAEAEAAARLHHPGIVPLFEVDLCNGRHFYTMALVEGGSLASRLTSNPFPPARAADLVRQVAEAVGYAHTRGIVHRDLKPANILLDAGNRPVVSDFGLAKHLESDSQLTFTGQVLGTPEYISPEQAAGRSERIGPAADVYSLGTILYRLLTGRSPFQGGTSMEILQDVARRDPTPPRRLVPIDRDLETICLKCLHKEPASRYPSASDLADDLRRWLAGEPIRARPVGPVGRTWRWCRRYPAIATAVAVAVTALVCGAAVAAWFALQATGYAHRADEKAQEAKATAHRAANRAYISDLRLVQRYWEDNLTGQARELLDAQRPDQTDGRDLRGFEWHYWQRQCRTGLRDVEYPVSLISMALRPDGRVYAVGGHDGSIRLCGFGPGRPLHSLTDHRGFVMGLAFSRDGKLLLSAGADRTAKVRDGTTGAVIRTLEGHTDAIHCAALSPDGQLAVTAGADRTVRLWDVGRGLVRAVCAGHEGPVWAVAVSPDGQLVASAGTDRTVRLWGADGRTAGVLRGHAGPVGGVTFGPGGQLASAGEDAVRVWSTATGQERMTLKADFDPLGPLAYSPVAFSPDGTLLAAGHRAVRVWTTADGIERQLWRGDTHAFSALSFTPDSATLLAPSQGHRLHVWDARAVPNPLVFRRHRSHVTAVACSPDGRTVATAGGTWSQTGNHYEGGELYLWDSTTGREVRTLVSGGAGICDVAFSPDGTQLASVGGQWDTVANRYRCGEVRLWNPATGAETGCYRDHADGALCVAFSPNGEALATAGFDRTVIVRNPRTGQVAWTRADHADTVTRVAFSPDGGTLATAGFDRTVRLRDVRTGDVQRVLKGEFSQIAAIAFSPDRRFLAVSDYTPRALVWDLQEGREAYRLRGLTRPLTCLTYSPDGRRLLGGGEDGSVRLYETGSGQEVLALRGHTDVVRAAAFGRGGRQVLSGGWDRTVRVYNASDD